VTDTDRQEPCLDPETLAAYLDGLLAVEAIGSADRHIDRCQSCRGELSALAATHSFPAGSGGARHGDLDLLALSLEGKLGRYEILRELGRGNMGIVVRAYDPELHRAVAVKLLASSPGAEAAQRLRREAQAMARLTHPNVVTVYDVTTHGEAVAIAMELVEGTTLRARIAKGRSWRELLAVCIAAGRGLAAAHAAKLIHRDFKPENVLCADDGRVVVSDFGLARIEDDAPVLSGDGSTTLAGTPAYMAPELLSEGGATATTASDQFSFCVATYEALYGERPFGGRTMDDLRASIVAGVMRPAPAGSAVPASVRDVLARGLSTEPARRFRSMDALLDELAASAKRRRWWPFAVGAGIALASVVTVFALRSGATCDLEDAPPPWDRSALDRALAPRPQMAARIQTGLETYWRAWNATRREACEATHVREELSERVLDARNGCLDRGRRELAELSSLVVRDPSLADRAIEGIERVRDPASCTADSSGEPIDPAIDRAAAHLAAGDTEQATKLIATVLAARPDARTRAEALYIRGRTELALGASEAAEATFAEALTDAERSRADQLVASIWVEIVQTTGSQQHRFEAARANMRAAEAAFTRIDPGPAVLARYAFVVGSMLLAHDDLAEARVQLERALASHGPSEHGERGMIHHALCDTLRQLHQVDAARAHCTLAEQELARAYGPDHLRLAAMFNVWGAVELQDNNVVAAREHMLQAVAIYEARGLTAERGYALTLSNIASTWMRAGDVDRAQPLYEKARDLFAKHHPRHAQRVLPIQGLAGVMLERGDYRTGIRYYEEGLEIIERVYGAQSDQASIALFNIALSHKRLGELDAATTKLERVLAIATKPGRENWSLVASSYDLMGSLAETRKDPVGAVEMRERAITALDRDDDPRTRAFIESSIGRIHLERNNYVDSITHYERSLAYYKTDVTDPYVVARVQFGLARGLWETKRDRARAVELAGLARDNFAKSVSGLDLDEYRSRVAAWLAERGRK
jgi:tetratricopeptide (TPR) repeat protein